MGRGLRGLMRKRHGDGERQLQELLELQRQRQLHDKLVNHPNREPTGLTKAFAVAVGYPCRFRINPRNPRPTLLSDAVFSIAVKLLLDEHKCADS